MNARAKAILEGYFERLLDADGLPAAQSGVKVVIAKGIEHVIRAPQTESPGVRLVLSAVRHGRQQALVELMAGNVQEGVKTRRGGYLAAVDCGQGASRCRFLPDVFLPDTPESAARWRTFLGRLAPDSRLGRDPQSGLSGRIPYRDGTWLSDLTFAPGEPLAIIPEVTRVNGNLSVSTASLATGHTVEVRGSLTAPAGLLATTPAPITRLGGELRLLDEAQSPEDLALTPGQLLAWGLRPGRCLWLGPRRLRFMSEGEGRATTFLLRPILTAGARQPEPPVSFDGQAWHRLELALPPGTRRRLAELMRNLRERLGLPADLVSDDPGRIIEAASRARGFLELLARARHAGRAAIGETDRAFLARLGADLAALAEAAAFTGRETPQDLGAKAEAAQRLIAGFDPERLAAAGALSVKPRDPLDAAALANDLEYLTILGQDTLNVDDVLRTAGRTLVFLNNVLSSKEAKARAAGMVGEVRAAVKKLIEGEAAEAALVELLKAEDSVITALRRALPERGQDLEQLSRRLKTLNLRLPSEIIADFRTAHYTSASAELAQDRRFLIRLDEFTMGNLDVMFTAVDSPGGAGFNLPALANALWVNLQSLLKSELKPGSALPAGSRPREVAAGLAERARALTPLLAAYNAGSTRTAG
jgi:hypothetical protein